MKKMNKKAVGILAATSVILGSIVPTGPVARAEGDPVEKNVNLLINPGFEDGMTGWDPDGLRVQSDFVASGQNAGVIGTGEGGGYVTIRGDFSDINKITISGKGAVSMEGEKALFGVDIFDQEGTRVYKDELVFTSLDEYTFDTMDITMPQNVSRIVVYTYKVADKAGLAYFDDLSVICDQAEDEEEEGGDQKVYVNTPEERDASLPDSSNLLYRHTLPCEIYRGNIDGKETYEYSYKSLKRAMWIWNFEVITDQAKTDELFAFAQEKGVNLFYMNTGNELEGEDSAVTKYPLLYRAFNAKAHQMGIDVEALDGASAWVRTENQNVPLSRIQRIVEFNAGCSSDAEKFDGIHHDNEPYTLPDWDERMVEIADEYLRLCSQSVEICHANNLTYAVDIPFWYDVTAGVDSITYQQATKAMNYHIIDLVDYVGVMAYRDFAEGKDGIEYHTKDEINYAASVSKDVIVGVETYDVPDKEANPPKVTFYQEGEAYMNGEIDKVENYFVNLAMKENVAGAGFKGMAIHYYDTYRAMSRPASPSAPVSSGGNQSVSAPAQNHSTVSVPSEPTPLAKADIKQALVKDETKKKVKKTKVTSPSVKANPSDDSDTADAVETSEEIEEIEEVQSIEAEEPDAREKSNVADEDVALSKTKEKTISPWPIILGAAIALVCGGLFYFSKRWKNFH